jgi:MGT family glycosyltransferase
VSRFLFVVPPLAGHVNPTISVARALQAQGHRVAWVAHPRRVRPLLPEGVELLPLDDGVSDEVWAPVLERAKNVRGLESLQFLWQDVLLPLARGMEPGVREAIRRFEADVVAVDHQALGGAFAARKLGVKWASLCTTSASVLDPIADLPKVKAWVAHAIADAERASGLEPAAIPDLSPHLVLVFTSRAMVGEELAWPAHYRFVGPSINDRPDATPFPWDRLRADAPRVFISLGTVSNDAGDAFYRTVVEAFRNTDLQIILAAPPERVGEVPGNFIVQARVPQLALLPKVHAVVCHGGHNTVCESLANGLPLAVAPIRDDQPVIAGQVVSAGAGLRLKFGRLRPDALRETVQRLLDEPTFRTAASALRSSFVEAGGAEAAAAHLGGLA